MSNRQFSGVYLFSWVVQLRFDDYKNFSRLTSNTNILCFFYIYYSAAIIQIIFWEHTSSTRLDAIYFSHMYTNLIILWYTRRNWFKHYQFLSCKLVNHAFFNLNEKQVCNETNIDFANFYLIMSTSEQIIRPLFKQLYSVRNWSFFVFLFQLFLTFPIALINFSRFYYSLCTFSDFFVLFTYQFLSIYHFISRA